MRTVGTGCHDRVKRLRAFDIVKPRPERLEHGFDRERTAYLPGVLDLTTPWILRHERPSDPANAVDCTEESSQHLGLAARTGLRDPRTDMASRTVAVRARGADGPITSEESSRPSQLVISIDRAVTRR